jgi:hypothetical protein
MDELHCDGCPMNNEMLCPYENDGRTGKCPSERRKYIESDEDYKGEEKQ